MRQQYVMGNWKMNGSSHQIFDLLHSILKFLPQQSNTGCVVFPPAIYLHLVQSILKDTPIAWGGQNLYPAEYGAFTGELSALMLKEFHCRYVLVGHSERRHILKEDENFVAEKFHHVKDHGMIPVLCVGETLSEREQGITNKVITQQISAVSKKGTNFFKDCIIAYEPVWAIGTGKTALPEQAQEAHAFIRHLIAEYDQDAANQMAILYGGSVNENNAASLFSMPDIDGGLIGGASLNASQFVEIIKCIN